MSSAASSSANCVTLLSQEQAPFVLPKEAAIKSRTIADLLDDSLDGESIPVLTVSTAILEKVVYYLTKHLELEMQNASEIEVREFDDKFIAVEDDILFKLVLASNFLDIKPLMELACRKIADYVEQCKTAEQLRERFNIVNDFEPEEEAELIRKHQWLQEDS